MPVLPLTWPIRVNGRLVCSCRKAADCISPAKHPLGRLVPRGLLDASTDEAVIRKWFTDEPAANLGVVTDKLVVLDIDPRHDGDSSLADARARPRLSDDLARADRRRRRACDLQVPGRRRIRQFQHRGDEPAARSRHRYPSARRLHRRAADRGNLSGRAYAWSVDHHPADIPIAEAPAWLVEALTAGKQPGSVARRDAAQWAIEKAGLVTEYRDMAVASVAGKLLRAVSLDPAFVATLVHDWNACHCSPPLPERAVADILDRIANREIARLEHSHA